MVLLAFKTPFRSIGAALLREARRVGAVTGSRPKTNSASAELSLLHGRTRCTAPDTEDPLLHCHVRHCVQHGSPLLIHVLHAEPRCWQPRGGPSRSSKVSAAAGLSA